MPVPEVRIEIVAALAAIAPILEGLRDYERLNLKPETRAIIVAAIQRYAEREHRLALTRNELDALLGHGYPDLPVEEITPEAFADLQEQVSTVGAAFAKFATKELATNLGLTKGTPQPK